MQVNKSRSSNRKIWRKLEDLERKIDKLDEKLTAVSSKEVVFPSFQGMEDRISLECKKLGEKFISELAKLKNDHLLDIDKFFYFYQMIASKWMNSSGSIPSGIMDRDPGGSSVCEVYRQHSSVPDLSYFLHAVFLES
jgi:CRISPR/Cas system type I-B associated protein Csh2 (Cas7 group RAMP superfamily)